MTENTAQTPNQPIKVPTMELAGITSFISQVYMWMTAGLLLTTAVTYLVGFTDSPFALWFYFTPWAFPVLFLTELVVVVVLSWLAPKLHPVVAALLFAFYAILNGVFFGLIVPIYTEGSVLVAFGATAGTFLVMSLYGFFTKSDLTSFGSLATMGLFGLLIGLVLNIFIQSDAISTILTFVGIIIFVVLIAYDTQKLKKLGEQAEMEGKVGSYAIRGALELYLDFVNLFIRLLQIFGKRR